VLRKTITLAVVLLTGAGATLRAQEYSFRTFGDSEGLTNLAIRKIYQDRSGFLWVSTENGIFRYDGDRFEAFGTEQGVPENSGAAFGDAPDGSLLIGGNFGLYHLSGNRFEKVAVPAKTIAWAQGIQSDGKGHTFLGTDAGLLELYSQPGSSQPGSVQPGSAGFSIRAFPQPQGTSSAAAYAVLIDGDVIWYGCGLELCRMDPRGTRVFSRESGLPGRALLAVQRDHAGNLWVCARQDGVYELPAGKSRFLRPNLPFPPGSLSGGPSIDSNGRILLTFPQGLLIEDGNGWQKIDRSAGLRGTVYSAFEDRQHSLWIGLAGLGLIQWRGYREWESYSAVSGLTSDIAYEVLPSFHGSFLVASESGLLRGERRPFGMSFKIVPGLNGFAVHSLQEASNGDLWIGTEARGVARVDPQTFKPIWFGDAQGLPGKSVYTLRFDREQRLWAATDVGLFMAKAPYRRFSRIAELPATRMWAIAEGTDGTLWFGGAGGLFEYAADRWKTITRADGLSNQEVLSLGAGPNGVMWIGYRYGGGIDRVHPKPGGFTIEKGVQRPGTSGLIYFLNFDASGRLWVGTQRGVDLWDGSHWIHYDMNDGMVWDDCNLNSFAAEPDGTVWIGTSAGLSRFKPLTHLAPDAPLQVVFTRLANGQTDISPLRNPSFGIHANSIAARYSALNAARQNGVAFRYRLGGASSAWTETDQRELQFANLAPGAYRLQIQARVSDGEWSANSAEFPFTILTPWYSTWWFAAVCLLIPLSMAAAILRLRFLTAKRREHELVLLVEEKTSDLRRANEELLRLSFTDPLTGLANRRVFDQTLQQECARLERMGATVSLLFLDIDHFKLLNDSQGHLKGDECLVQVGAELTRLCKRQVDLAARCGGEEFAIILPETSASDAWDFANTVRQAIADLRMPHPASPVAPFLTVSIGVATANMDWCTTREALVAAADRALYAAKSAGRNRVCLDERDTAALEPEKPSSLISA
jgi:diguanylate cyclase (GGDEF)-like protein